MARKVIRVTWPELAAGLGVEYVCPTEDDIRAATTYQAAEWIASFQERESIELTDGERAEVLIALDELVRGHWSAATVLGTHVPIDDLVDVVNGWCRQGIRSNTTTRLIPAGDGIVSVEQDEEGVEFVLESPLLCAHIDCLFLFAGEADDGLRLKNMTNAHLLALLKTVLEAESGCRGGKLEGKYPIRIDLTNWDSQREPPTYRWIMDRVERRRELAQIDMSRHDAGHDEPRDDDQRSQSA